MSKMPKLPEALKQAGRPKIIEFHDDEYLYRRVPTSIWGQQDSLLTVDAIRLPDISMARSLLGHPEWVRLDVAKEIYRKNWGVLGIKVKLIPEVLPPNKFTYRVSHVPLEYDYPHSEVQAYNGETHLSSLDSVLPEDLHLEWRVKLLEAFEVMIAPHEYREIRLLPPSSHVPEPY